MPRFYQFVFIVSLLALSWLGMMAIHELGHVIGALATGGSVNRVVLYPLTISRTDVSPNPHPGLVVWLGPIVGCLIPLAVFALVPRRFVTLRNIAHFFAAFCLIANGAYIGIGSFDQVGDCGEMLRTGTPIWVMWTFGAVTVLLGLFMWHCLGSIRTFIEDPSLIRPPTAILILLALTVFATVGFTLSPR
jgi:hypothetical protein